MTVPPDTPILAVDSSGTQFIYSSLADEPELTELIALFVGDLSRRSVALAAALAQGELRDLRNIAHKMAGACGSYGFQTLSIAARRVEAIAETGTLQQVRAEVHALVLQCERVRVAPSSLGSAER